MNVAKGDAMTGMTGHEIIAAVYTDPADILAKTDQRDILVYAAMAATYSVRDQLQRQLIRAWWQYKTGSRGVPHLMVGVRDNLSAVSDPNGNGDAAYREKVSHFDVDSLARAGVESAAEQFRDEILALADELIALRTAH
jgi:hypothetical protein